MRELAMRAVGVLMGLEDGQDRLLLGAGDGVHRMPARRAILKRPGQPPLAPAPRPGLAEFEVSTGAAVIPAVGDRGIDERKQRVLGGRRHSPRDPATQSQRPFPSASIKRTPISFSASVNRAISAFAAASSGSGPDPGRTPGFDAASASNAP